MVNQWVPRSANKRVKSALVGLKDLRAFFAPNTTCKWGSPAGQRHVNFSKRRDPNSRNQCRALDDSAQSAHTGFYEAFTLLLAHPSISSCNKTLSLYEYLLAKCVCWHIILCYSNSTVINRDWGIFLPKPNSRGRCSQRYIFSKIKIKYRKKK